jgi:hypothetical protein
VSILWRSIMENHSRTEVKNLRKTRLALSLLMTLAISVNVLPAQESPQPQSPDPPSDAKPTATASSAIRPKPSASSKDEHRFWDKNNDGLFAGVAAARTLDYFSTLNMRRRGRQEILLTNDVVDDHAAFAVVEAAGTGVSIGAAYLFHRYEHHKLERWVSIVHIGLATSGSIRNYCLKTFHTRLG